MGIKNNATNKNNTLTATEVGIKRLTFLHIQEEIKRSSIKSLNRPVICQERLSYQKGFLSLFLARCGWLL